MNAGFIVSSSLVDSMLDDPSGISPVCNDDIEMDIQTLLVTNRLQPPCEGTLAVTFRADEDAFALRNMPSIWQDSAK